MPTTSQLNTQDSVKQDDRVVGSEDLDAIVTEKKYEETQVKMVTMVVEDRSFSGGRGWCCLGARRSS